MAGYSSLFAGFERAIIGNSMTKNPLIKTELLIASAKMIRTIQRGLCTCTEVTQPGVSIEPNKQTNLWNQHKQSKSRSAAESSNHTNTNHMHPDPEACTSKGTGTLASTVFNIGGMTKHVARGPERAEGRVWAVDAGCALLRLGRGEGEGRREGWWVSVCGEGTGK